MKIVVVRVHLGLDRNGMNRLGLDRNGMNRLGPAAQGRLKPEAIGPWLRRLRRRHHISTEGIAAYLGCRRAAVERLERGHGMPSVWMVALYLRALGYELVLDELRGHG
jgi:hypothetical protein